jgi:hypothetical protein
MRENRHILTPFEGVGPYRFEATPTECAAVVGPPERSREKRALGRTYEQRGLVEAVYEGGVLVQATRKRWRSCASRTPTRRSRSSS